MGIGALVCLLAAGTDAAAGPLPPGAAAAIAAVHPSSLAARAHFLSLGELRDLGTGATGQDVAAAYLAAELQALGLAPAGDDGTFLQPVPLRSWRVDQDGASLVLAAPGRPSVSLRGGQDFLALSTGEQSEVEVDAPVVFAGYAITAPEYGYDDLRGVDLRGKIALVLEGAPLSDRPNYFPPLAHAAYADPAAKLRRLAERGAAGILFARTPASEAVLPWATLAHRAREEDVGSLEGARLAAGASGVPAGFALSSTGFEKLLAAAGVPGGARAVLQKAEAGRLAPQPLPLRVRLHSSAEMREFRSLNVAALLRGSDAAKAREVVVLSVDVNAAEPGDSPAEGEAAGGAVLLEIARVLAAMPSPPRRSVLFLAAGGGRRPAIGARYFAKHPTVAADRIAADLHVERTPGRGPLVEVVAAGADDSTLSRPVRSAAAGLELGLAQDPGADAFAACGAYPFAAMGVPGVCLSPGPGNGVPGPPAPGRAAGSGPDWEGLARFTRFELLLALLVADAETRPSLAGGGAR
ncbi:MAG TPA: M28 family peptidase [Anaeromyxobacteraceae bacterium]|nr:M28 family peptidase [Anaeromyxobacteraceae bacterium]